MEDSSTLAPPKTSVTTKKPDWFVNSLQGLVPQTLNEMHGEGTYANNFSIEEPETYWGKKAIKASFTDESGKERRDLFDQEYARQLNRYKTHRDTELNLVNFISPPNITAERSGINTSTPTLFKTQGDPMGRNFQSGYAFSDGFSAQERSMKETALSTGVRQDNGSYVGTKDFTGKAKFAMGDKGGLLLNEDGRPYLIPVKDGEQLHSWDVLYNPLSEKLGAYGQDYGLGNFASSVVKNPVNFASQSVDDLIEYGRGFLNFWGLDTKGSDKALNNAENWAKGIRVATTEGNEGDFYNLENVVDMSQQVLLQLGSMAAVGGTIMALTKNPKLASVGSKLFMTALSAGSMAEIARDNGLSKRESAILLGITSAAFYPLMALSEAAIGKLATKESKAALTDTIRQATNNGILIKEIAKNPTKATLRTLYGNLKDGGKSWAFRMEKSAPLAVGAVSESIEESAEQVVDLAVRGGYNAYSYGADDAKHPFTINWSNEMSALGQAATGGAIGGTAAHSIFSRLLKNRPEVANELHEMVLEGKGGVIKDFVSKMHSQGRLDHNWITQDSKITSPDRGNSRNDEAKNVLDGLVDYIEELRDASGIKDVYKNNKSAALSLFADVVNSSSVGKDAADLSTKIVSLSTELEKAKIGTPVNTELVSSLQTQIDTNQEVLQKIIKGEFVHDYVSEGLYNMLSATTKDPALASLTGKEFTKLTNALPGSHKVATEASQQVVQKQAETDKTATAATPEGASEARVQELSEQVKADYQAQHLAAAKHIETLSAQATESGEPLIYPENLAPTASPESRQEETNVLKGLPMEDPSMKEALTRLIQAAENLQKVEKTKGVKAPEPPKASDELLKMTQGKDVTIASSPSTIADKIGEEFALRSSSVANGISLYSNTAQLTAIKESISKRIGQTRALMGLTAQLGQVRQIHSQSPLPEIPAEELVLSLNSLTKMMGITNELLAESEANSASADLKVAQATSTLLGKTADYLNTLSETVVGTEFAPIHQIIASARPAIHEAIEKSDVKQALRLMNEVETAIHTDYSSRKESLLALFKNQEYSEFSRRTYDYVRGILSLSSSDFWNAYHSVLINSNSGIFSPTDEHSIVVKQAVQGLMSDVYSPPSINHPNQILHHNSVFVEGRGGTAKTKTMVPLIAGIVQVLTGGKVFLTAAKDINDYKRTTLLSAVENFYRISDKQLGIQLKSSTKDILEFLDTPGATTDVNLIVYDEGTLLSTKQLAEIQARVNRLNRQRIETGNPLLKVLYTGDTVQNSIGVNKSDPDSRAIGIDDVNRHVIQRTPALTFSFRQSNQQLTLFSAYLESIQREQGISRPFSTEYHSREGVQIQQGYEEFISSAVTYINSLAKQTRLHEAVYITDKGKFSTDQRILDSGILVMTSEEAQGREWPIVFFDPINSSLFAPNYTNLGVKKDYYTAATRASSYLLTHIIPGQGISSSEGMVNKVRPLTPEQVTRKATIEKVVDILGNHSAPVSNVSFDYTKVTVAKGSDEFPMGDESENPLTSQPFADSGTLVSSVDTQGARIIEYLTGSNREGLVSMHTFFTNELHSFDEQMKLKRKAIYDRSARKTIPYFLSVNRIGSPGYENVLRNDPEFIGSYAVFIEAGPAGNNVVLGTLSSPGLDAAIKEGNLLQGRESIRIPLAPEFLSDSESLAPTVFNKLRKVKSLGSVKNDSKGIRFGTPYIVTTPRAEKNVKGDPKAKAGEIFVPASFYYTPEEITKVLAANNSSPYITKVPVRTTYLPFKEIVSRLDNFFEDGKFNFNADNGLSGRLYDAFWSHNAESGTRASGLERESRLSVAFKSLRDQVPQSDPFYKFLDTYVEKEQESETSEMIRILNELEGVKSKDNNNARYFLKHYLEAENAGQTQKLVNFERAISLLSTHPYFKKGFEFNPRILYSSTGKAVTAHAQARQLPAEIYETYLEGELDYVSPPVLRIPLNHLISAIKDASPQADTQAEELNKLAEEGVAMDEKRAKEVEAELAQYEVPYGQSPVEYAEPTISESASGTTEDQNVVSDSSSAKNTYEDDSLDPDPDASSSLEEFQTKWFDKPGYSTMFPESVRTFKRGFMNHLFTLNAEDGTTPFLVDISEAVKTLTSRSRELSKTYDNAFMDNLDVINDQGDRDLYVRGVIAREFDFLLGRYFPAVYQEPTTKQYKYRSRHHKQRSFSEKESFNLLAEGMTDMVKTQLYNTPLIRRLPDGTWVSSGDYVWEGDIETLVSTVAGSATAEEISAKLQGSPNQAAQSVYMRFLHNEPYVLDGKSIWSIGMIQNPEVFQMRDSVLQFMLSGQVYDLTKVNLDDEKLKAPWSVWGTPNNLREISHQSVSRVAENQGKFIVVSEDGSAIIGALTVNPSTVAAPTDQNVVDAIHAIGLTNFSGKNLKEMQELDFPKFNISPSSDVAQKVNSAIIDQIILPTMKKMASERFVSSSFRKLNILYDSIIRSSGAPNILSDVDVNGNRSYRLRWGAPIYRLSTQIEEVKAEGSSSPHSGNLLVNGSYQVEKIPIKSGFESWKKSKQAKAMSAKEIGDFDLIWSFAHMLKETHADSGQYNVAMMTPMVWSDSPTDPQMIVRVPKGYFRSPQSILGELYTSRKTFYAAQSAKILSAWNDFLLTRSEPYRIPASLQELKSLLDTHTIPYEEVAAFPGMVDNLYYVKAGKTVTIKSSLVYDVNYYTGNNLSDFIKKADSHYADLLTFSNSSLGVDGTSMTERLGKVIEGRSGQEVLKAFYYNWLAFSTEFSNLTAGAIQQYKDKGKGETDEYIDNVKRNKLLMANRSSQLFRNQSWKHLHNQAKLAGIPLSEEMRYEGKKLPRIGKIAYVRDIREMLTIPSGLKKNQEIYDGATFVLPTTRLMQKHSNSGNHGIYVGSVMKNVTTILNNEKGVPTYIKNAEFLLTPELMRKGTPRLVNLVRKSYMSPFKTPIQTDGIVLFTPLDFLRIAGMKEDFSNANWEHFTTLLAFLVENGEQDSLILEIAPDSSVKTGRGATNDIDSKEPFVTENFDQVNKGTQLDASHGIDEASSVRGSQIINAMSVNWPLHTQLMRMYNGLAEIAYTKIQEWRGKSPAERIEDLKAVATNTFAKRGDTSYASKLTSPSNSNNFSLDDRQVVTSVIRSLNSELTDDAVLLDFEGGQYIIHPTNGLIQVYDAVVDGKPTVSMRDELPQDAKGISGRDLKWNREDGYAEILLPASMRTKFGIKAGMRLNEITPEYFTTLAPEKARKAARMFSDFQRSLSQLVTRIPATGPHSGVAAKVVGFIEESENAIFVPAELLFVQGADQDVDKGTSFSYEVVGGIVPDVDEGFDLKTKTMFSDKLRKKAHRAGIKNAIVGAMEQIMLSPSTLISRNTPVDTAKEELEEVAKGVEATYDFKRDSYVSYLKMREINQAGMTLRGIFSNAMKAYDVMTIAFRSKNIDPSTMGLSTDIKVRDRIGALVNAAVDNAKDQLLGKLGIGEHNANMVSYMVMKGMSFVQIHEQLLKYAPQMEQVKDYRRYDSREPFRASVQWSAFPELASLNYLGNEVSALSRFAINRSLPSSDVDMLAYRKGVEAFVNGQYKSFNQSPDFKLISFLENSEYAEQQTTKYGSLKGKKAKGGIERSSFNILQILQDAPHIKAYMQVFLLSHNLASESKLYKVSSRLADEVMSPTSQLDDRSERILSDMKEFTYGLFIDQYLQNAENPTKYDLSSPEGRKQFVNSMDEKYINTLKTNYPVNSFVDSLTITPDKKRNWNDSSILRLPDLQQTTEEKRMQIQSDFAALAFDDRKTMVLYNLITRHGKFGKDSFGSIMSVADKADLNRFLDKVLDITSFEYGVLSQTFNDFRAGTGAFHKDNEAIHNSIPYQATKPAPAPPSLPVQLAEAESITPDTAERLSRYYGSPIGTKTPLSEVSSIISSILSTAPLNPMEIAYLKGLKQDIAKRESPDAKTVEKQAQDCSPK